jgi:phospholipase C
LRLFGIRGSVVDVTGDLVAVQERRSLTIFVVDLPFPRQADPEAGDQVAVRGRVVRGIVEPTSFRVVERSPWPAPSTPAQEPGRIDHVLFLVQENHSFDNYFGSFPGADGPDPDARVEGVAPFHLPAARSANMPHSWGAAHAAVNEGRMDRFVTAARSRDTMGYYDGRDLPNYWAYARHFTLADRFFSSTLGPSLPNHLAIVAAQTGGVTRNWGSGFDFPTLPEALSAAGVSWKYYGGSRETSWVLPLEPLGGFRSFQSTPALASRVVVNTDLFRDLRDGSLPSVAWIVPNIWESEHPPMDVQIGMWYVTTVVNALAKSPYWANTLLVLTWDEYGGFYDHVPPPVDGEERYGMRVPAILLGPSVRPGRVDHTVYDFSSVLRLIEDRFRLPRLARRDARAGDLGAALHPSQEPLAPFLIGKASTGGDADGQ